MKWQVTDGLSRENLLEGVMKSKVMLGFVPLHLSALDRDPALRKWLDVWCGEVGDGVTPEFLTPSQWYTHEHDDIDGGCMKDGIHYPSY